MANSKADSGVSEDELCGQFLSALEKVQYFGTAASGDDEEALQRATNLFHSALADMKQSGCKEIDLKILADTFKLQATKQETREIPMANSKADSGVSEDELCDQFLSALEKVKYFGTAASGDDVQQLQRAKNLFHSAFADMKQSGCKEIDLKILADTFKLQGNKAMESKLYPDAIELYTVAIALCSKNAIYYCNRAAAYTHAGQHAEAIIDCQKAIAIDPKYIKAYCRLGYIYSAQGKYIEALEKGYDIAKQLDPTNQSVKEYVRAAQHNLWQQREERGQKSNWSYSNGVMRLRDPVDGDTTVVGGPDTNPGELYMILRAGYQAYGGVLPGDEESHGN